jgi:hypothetical protein
MEDVVERTQMWWARRWVAVAGAAVLATSGLVMGVASASDHGHDHGAPVAGILPPGDWTPEQVAFATDLVRQVEAAQPEYLEPDELTALGFSNFGVTAPGGWDHWNNNDERMRDGHILNPEVPESVMMRRTPEGYRLEAVLFRLDRGSTMDDIPEEIAWLPGWHVHDGDLCVNEDGSFAGLQLGGTCSAGTPLVSVPMVHVWTVDNACGHRFPGVGASGLMCDDHHEPPGHTGPPGTVPGTWRPPGGSIPPAPVDPPTSTPTTSAPSTTAKAGNGTRPTPVAPKPVTATPRYTG